MQKRSWRAATWTLVHLAAFVGGPWVAAQSRPLSPDAMAATYCQAVKHYVHGDLDSAAALLTRMAAADRRRLSLSDAACKDDSVTREAAAVLELELAVRERNDLDAVLEHLGVGEWTAQHLLPTDHRPSADEAAAIARFQERWFVAATSLVLAWSAPGQAMAFAERGLHTVERSAPLHLLAGSCDEMRAHQADSNGHDRRPIAAIARSPLRARLVFAADHYQRAVDLDPSLAMARVRLGRVLFLRGEAKPGREALDVVVGMAGASAEARYLAHLFLGAIDEFEYDREAARTHYEAARALGPTVQTPVMALSFVERQLGHDDRAAALIADWARREDDGTSFDPWWNYQNGRFDTEAFDRLRDAVQR